MHRRRNGSMGPKLEAPPARSCFDARQCDGSPFWAVGVRVISMDYWAVASLQPMPSQVQNGAAAKGVDPTGKKRPKERDDGHALSAQALRTECLQRVQRDIVVDEDDDPWVSSFGMQHVRSGRIAAAPDALLLNRVQSY